MVSNYLRRQPVVRRDLKAAHTHASALLFRVGLTIVGIGGPLYFGGHVLVAHLRQLL